MSESNTERTAIGSERRGLHWIAWRVDATGKRLDAVVVVGETREEAESRAAEWQRQNRR